MTLITRRSRPRAAGITTLLALPLVLIACSGTAAAAGTAEPSAIDAQPTTVAAAITRLNVTYSATLTSGVTGAGIAGETVSFVQGSAHCTGVTDFGGAASCAVPFINILSLLLAQPYTATFAGDAAHGPSSATGVSALI
jgi:hypothetical protein